MNSHIFDIITYPYTRTERNVESGRERNLTYKARLSAMGDARPRVYGRSMLEEEDGIGEIAAAERHGGARRRRSSKVFALAGG